MKFDINPRLMKKIKIFAAVGVVGFIVVGALVVIAGIAAFNYLADQTQITLQNPENSERIEKLKLEVSGLSNLQPTSCWDKVESLMAVEPWLAKPAIENLNTLKVACFAPSAVPPANDGA